MKSSVLYAVISLSGMVFGAEIVASHITQSLVLLISAYHMLYNILSLLLLVLSYRMSKEKTLKNTFGWARVKVLGLLVNMLFLSALCFAATVESVQTMVHASHEDTEPKYPLIMIILGVINFSVNIICFILIGGYTHHQGCSMIIKGDDMQANCIAIDTIENGKVCSTSPRSSSEYLKDSKRFAFSNHHQFLDVSRDISSCLVVIACGCILLTMNGLILKYADAILAIASVAVLLGTTYPFIREFGLILLQSIPNHIDVAGLTKKLLSQYPDVLNVHHLHVWRLTTSEIIATVHIILRTPESYSQIDKTLTKFFQNEGISSVTIQPEFHKGEFSEKIHSDCILNCSISNNCKALTCCGPLSEERQFSARLRPNVCKKEAFLRSNSFKSIPTITENDINLEQVPLKVENSSSDHSQNLAKSESNISLLDSNFDFTKVMFARETSM